MHHLYAPQGTGVIRLGRKKQAPGSVAPDNSSEEWSKLKEWQIMSKEGIGGSNECASPVCSIMQTCEREEIVCRVLHLTAPLQTA